MNPRDVLTESVAALSSHRLRTTLSSIGIIFGVATVVTALAIGEGARRAAFEEIGALGVENVFVRATRPPPAPGRHVTAPAPVLDLADTRALAGVTPDVAGVAAVRSVRTEAASATGTATIELVGATSNWRDIVRVAPSTGRWVAESDERERRRVAVVGDAAARRLFAGAAPLGRRVRAAGTWYTVVGVMDRRGEGTRLRSTPRPPIDLDMAIIVPLAAMDASLGEGDAIDRVQEIAIRSAGPDSVGRVAVLASAVMRRRHGAGGYEVIVPRELLQTRLRAQRTFDGVLLGIGGLALLISGIGIMNIMLASVAERTQEIGVRRAFGARQREVVAQFAAEAALLCLAGGVAGVPVGAALAGVVGRLAGWPVSISLTAVALAVCASTAVGLAFGVYPARMAAAIQPVDALRAP